MDLILRIDHAEDKIWPFTQCCQMELRQDKTW